MRFVKDHELVGRQQHRTRSEVRGVEVGVDDQQLALGGAVLRQFSEARLALGALR